MPCDQNPTTLAAYLDGELPTGERIAFQQHLRGCTHCAAEIAELVSLRRSLLPARSAFTPTAEFRRRIQQQIVPPRQRPTWMLFMPAAMAFAAMLLVIVAIGWMQHARRADAFTEVADLHVNALASTNPYDIVSSDRHTVKPWFQGKIPFSFNLPEFAGTEFTLLGGRLVYLHQQPGAQLIVAVRQHKISVLILQESSGEDRAFDVGGNVMHRNAFSMATWHSQGLRFFIIGDADPSEIEKLARSLQQVNQ
jgi:anti-sigma factor RsiW